MEELPIFEKIQDSILYNYGYFINRFSCSFFFEFFEQLFLFLLLSHFGFFIGLQQHFRLELSTNIKLVDIFWIIIYLKGFLFIFFSFVKIIYEFLHISPTFRIINFFGDIFILWAEK